MLFKRNEIWYYKFTISGKTIYRSTGATDKAKAKKAIGVPLNDDAVPYSKHK